MLGIRSIVLTAVCVVQLCLTEAITIVEHQKLEFPGKELIFNADSQVHGKLTYAACTKNKDTKERHCKVVLEKSPYSDETYTCNVTVKLDRRKNSDMDEDRLTIVPFAKNKAVLSLVEKVKNDFIKLNMINFDACKVDAYEIEDPIDPDDLKIVVPYNDSLDVYFLNHLDNQKYHLMKFDANGHNQQLLAPTDAETYVVDVTRILPISESRDKGTLFTKHTKNNKNEYEFIIRKPDGSNISLGKRMVYEPLVLSTNNDLVGICFKIQKSDPIFNCTQNDLNGGEKFNINPMKGDDKTTVTGVHNLPGGGMLIALVSCKQRVCSFNDVHFSAIKVDSTGKSVRTAHIGNVKATTNANDAQMSLSFHTNKHQNYCISIAVFESTETTRRKGGEIVATDYCFTDADFKK